MQVTYIGHACILFECDGTTLLMDPWLTDPTYHGTWWHYPPLRHSIRDLPKIDFLYVSHEHPDHFDPPTLSQLDKDTHIVIANFRRKRFRDRLAQIGFKKITELDFGQEFRCNGSRIHLRLIPPDRAWDDSAILIKAGDFTMLNVNDCHLDAATLSALGASQQIDLAFLTFTGASQYPNCFSFPIESKLERYRHSKIEHREEFVHWAKLLKTKRAVPAAGNFALLAEDQLFMNTAEYANTPAEAVAALHQAAPEIEGLQMNPGDTWSPDRGHQRHHPAPDWSRREEDIERLSADARDKIAEYFASEPVAPPDLYEQFRSYFHRVITADRAASKKVPTVVWWEVTGPNGGNWSIDFRRDADWVSPGIAEDWNQRITISDNLVYQGVSERGIWDNLILSFRIRLARRPDRYNKEFWTWLCKL